MKNKKTGKGCRFFLFSLLLSFLYSFDIGSSARIEPDDITLIDEHRHLHDSSGFEGGGFCSVARGVALFTRRSLGYLQISLNRPDNVDDLLIPLERHHLGVLLGELRCSAGDIFLEREALAWIFGVTEPIFVAVVIEILYWELFNFNLLEALIHVEVALQNLARDEILDRGLSNRLTLLHAQERKLNYLIRRTLVDEHRSFF